ncbi:hypothetical protein [Sphingobium algorifonticola]|uniref:Uncharacterized protein n=1 Tax=Sphingobium algorifonticola TaxID=2008318 RepID=A0A437J9Q9_9SPHN|nr:hypothetical protein [Sphingobium algorifonticola]RVT42204.1 hypothetical protein ENE74_08320 [Sphingobium algorifonticola]
MTDAATPGRGRPLRFLLLVLLCWAGGRVAMTQDWGAESHHPPTRLFAEAQQAASPAVGFSVSVDRASAVASRAPRPSTALSMTVRPRALRPPSAVSTGGGAMQAGPLLDYMRFSVAFANRTPAPAIVGGPQPIADIPGRGMAMPLPGTAFTPAAPPTNRLNASAWLFWRDAGGGALAAGAGQLGGAQAGVRIAYALTPAQPERLALYARATSALRRPHAHEAALGLAFQPSARVPLRLTVERRANLGDGGRNAFATGVIGGFGPVAVTTDATVEAYGQAGIVGLARRDAYVDGKVSVMHALPGIAPVAAGFSLSGGAQPQVARLDIGPQLSARLRLGGNPARISAEWRERIAGNARPGSGLAVTLAADF